MRTIPNPSHEKLRKQNTLFLFFYCVPLPPPKGTKDQGRKLAPGTDKDIIAYGRAEPSGLHPCHRKRNGVVFKGKGIANEERRAAADGSLWLWSAVWLSGDFIRAVIIFLRREMG